MIEVAEQTERTIDCFAKNIYEVPEVLRVLGPLSTSEEITEDMGCFRILSPKDGDKRVVWCRKVLAEIKAAKQMFMDLLHLGMIPYKVGVDGKATSEEMQKFDPTAEEVIFMPLKAIRGG